MSNKYHRLCAENRKVIGNMKQAGKTQSEIAQAIGFSQSAISKELSSNHGERGYRPAQGERLAKERKSQKRTRPKVMVGIIKDKVEARLRIYAMSGWTKERLTTTTFPPSITLRVPPVPTIRMR